MAQVHSYEMIVGFDNIEKILGQYGKNVTDSDDQLEFNSALVFFLTEKSTLVMSNAGTKAVLFKDPGEFRAAVAAQSFPDAEPLSLFAPDVKYILTLAGEIEIFLHRLESLGCGVAFDSIDSLTLGELSVCINKFGKKNVTDSTYVAIAVVFGEIIRRDLNGKWDIVKEYDLNPYYLPHLVIPSGKRVYFLKRFHEHWDRKGSINLPKLKEDIWKYDIKGYFAD